MDAQDSGGVAACCISHFRQFCSRLLEVLLVYYEVIHCNESSSSSALQSLLYGGFMTASTWAKLGDRRR